MQVCRLLGWVEVRWKSEMQLVLYQRVRYGIWVWRGKAIVALGAFLEIIKRGTLAPSDESENV